MFATVSCDHARAEDCCVAAVLQTHFATRAFSVAADRQVEVAEAPRDLFVSPRDARGFVTSPYLFLSEDLAGAARPGRVHRVFAYHL